MGPIAESKVLCRHYRPESGDDQEQKLRNEKFVSKAPEAVVNAEREKAEKARALIAKLDESAAAMKG